ncbi:hypothetical protein WMF20_31860 [Sorangium sp. So ce834]|uniref:hypothetical protein n=1 Tax=Sorangium sp. So ce834 TaxID=3133321 RepID=UPI003F61038A
MLSQVRGGDELGRGRRGGDGRFEVPEAKVVGVGELGVEPLDLLAGVLLDGERDEEDTVVLAGAGAARGRWRALGAGGR